jgi:two-component system phosphate regulon sensor histidine kinase PhoR
MNLTLPLLIISAVLLVLFIRGLMKLKELSEFVEDLAWGNLGRRLYLKGNDRYARLMKTLSSIAEQLQDRTREADELRYRLATVLRKIPDGLALLDDKDRVKLVNPVFEGLFKMEESELVGKELGFVVDVPELVPLIRGAKESGQRRTGEFVDESGRHLHTMVMPFSEAKGWYAGSVIIFRDVTAEKRTDQVRKDFVANVSHELKTPITAVRGFTETLLDGALENREDAVRFLKTMKLHSERMERLIQDLITLSRIEFGAMPFDKKPVQLGPLVAEVLKVFEGRAAEKGVALRKEIEEGCSLPEADPARLEQILLNLLDNALKYTDEGSVNVRAARDSEGGCTLSVEDTGIGIPRKYIPRLGERFFRVDPSRSRELGGTGLGLAIVKHLVKAHGWRMEIQSEVGRGTAVRIHLV